MSWDCEYSQREEKMLGLERYPTVKRALAALPGDTAFIPIIYMVAHSHP